MIIPRIQLWKIARSFVRRGGKFLYDEKGVPQDRIGTKTNLTGLFTPITLYHAIEKYESMTLYELRDEGLYTDEEFDFIKQVDKVQVWDDDEWLEAIQEKIDDELKAIHEQQRKSKS